MIFKLCATGLLSAVIGVLLSEMGWRGKRIFTAVCAALLLSVIAEELGALFGELVSVSESAGISETAECALKIVGVGYIFGITSDICTELGEKTVAGALTAAGRIEVVVLIFPYFRKILSFGLELMA